MDTTLRVEDRMMEQDSEIVYSGNDNKDTVTDTNERRYKEKRMNKLHERVRLVRSN